MFSLFLRQKILMVKNSFSVGNLIRRLPFIALGAGFWVLLYYATYRGLAFVRGTGMFGEVLSERLLSLALFVVAGFLTISTIITSLSTFYLSGDVPFLLSNPVKTSDILKVKSFESVILSSWMVVLFIEPVFIAYGRSYHAAVPYYAVSFFAFLMLVLTVAGVGMTAAHLLTKVFPARRSREIILGLGLLLFLAFYFAIKSNLPQGYGYPEDFLRTFTIAGMDSPVLPGYWVMRTLLPFIKSQTADFSFMGVLLGSSLFFLLASMFVGSRLYRRNIEKIRPSEYARTPLRQQSYPGPSSAVFFKDIRIFFRETGQWSQMFIIGALLLIYLYNFKSVPLRSVMKLSPFAKEILVAVNLFMAGLVLVAMAARFLYTSVSFEGGAFWVVRSAPMSIKRFLWSKFLLGWIPLTGVVIFLVSLTDFVLGVNGALLVMSEATALLLSLSVCGLGTGLGALFPRFEYDNIASVAVGIGAMTFMLLAFGLVTATLSAGAWDYYVYVTSIRGSGLHMAEGIRMTLYLVMILLVNAAAFYLPMKAGIRKLQTMHS